MHGTGGLGSLLWTTSIISLVWFPIYNSILSFRPPLSSPSQPRDEARQHAETPQPTTIRHPSPCIPRQAWGDAAVVVGSAGQRFLFRQHLAFSACHAPAAPKLSKSQRRLEAWGPKVDGSRGSLLVRAGGGPALIAARVRAPVVGGGREGGYSAAPVKTATLPSPPTHPHHTLPQKNCGIHGRVICRLAPISPPSGSC